MEVTYLGITNYFGCYIVNQEEKEKNIKNMEKRVNGSTNL